MKIIAKYLLPILPLWAIHFFHFESNQIYQLVCFAIAFVYYLGLDNTHNRILTGISISFASIPLIHILYITEVLHIRSASILIYTFSLIIVSLYLFRFWQKPHKWTLLELLKPLAVVQFTLLYSIDMVELGRLSIVILGFVYITTRISQLPNTTKIMRNVITAILVLACIFFMVLAQIQGSEAKKQTRAAMMSLEEVSKLKKEMQEMEELRIVLEAKLNAIQKVSESKFAEMKEALTKCGEKSNN